MFSLGGLFEVMLLCVNGMAVLQDFSPNLDPKKEPMPRFLHKMGLTEEQHTFGGATSVKGKLIQVTNAVRTLMRVPLIVINTLVVLYLIFLG